MKCKEIKYYLNDYLNGKLIDELREEIKLHLTTCQTCRKRTEDIKSKLRSHGVIRKQIHQSREFWEGISEPNDYDANLRMPDILFSPLKSAEDPKYKIKLRKKHFNSGWVALSAPILAILLAIILAVLYFTKTSTTFWQVENLKGTPTVGNEKLESSGILPLGEWLKTDAVSEARLKIGMVGNLDVSPETKLQLINTKDSDYRVYLDQGKIHAKTWAPPKLFTVETPYFSAIDLGCIYTLEVDKNGSSILLVNSGSVELKSIKDEKIIPAGAVCETRKNKGMGTPYFSDASIEFKDALTRFDFENGGDKALKTIFENSRKRDALSLWYLLKESTPGRKNIIYNKLTELISPPSNVTESGIMKNKDRMLYDWWEKLGYGKKSDWDLLN